MENNLGKDRLTWLDAMKGIGILAIMRVHMLGPKEWIHGLFYVGCVAMFFIIAGFNLKFVNDNKSNIIKKAKRLLIPYFIYSFFFLLLEHHFNANTITHVIGIFYARMFLYHSNTGNISFLQIGNAPMWFLPAMFLAYLWIYLFYSRCRNKYQKLCLFSSFVVLSAITYFSPYLLPWSIDTSFIFACLIIIGYEYKYVFLNAKVIYALITTIVWTILFIYFRGSNISIGEYGKYGIYSIIPFMIISLVETYSLAGFLKKVDNTLFVRILAYIGRHSLRLMCIHLVIYNRCEMQFGRFFDVHEYKYLTILLSFIIIFIIDYIIERFLTKYKTQVPIMKYL